MLVSTSRSVLVLLCCLTFAACGTRSISNSGYEGNPYYRGELSEFAVVGVNPTDSAEAGNTSSTLTLLPGSRVLLIQSGADIPDGELVAEMERYYRVSVFSGAPDHDAGDAGSIYISDKNYANALQSAAEQGGIDHIVCVWGFVEDLRDRKAGKTISWVPILGSIVPDEEQHMSIRLKVAVVDVRTGRWDIFSPPVYDTSRFSSHITREDVDQEQVSSLKGQAYYAAVGALQTRLSAR